VQDTACGNVVGTYRVQTYEIAAAGLGFYSTGEFDLSFLPLGVLKEAVELGRACVAREHRHTRVLFLLWKGIAAYLLDQRKRYLFGCCSLASQDPREGLRLTEWLKAGGHLHPSFFVPPRPGFECLADEMVSDGLPEAKVPKLLGSYLRFGAKFCGLPAVDREFRTIDYFGIFDVKEMGGPMRRLFFGA
jgi:putative hemolysin